MKIIIPVLLLLLVFSCGYDPGEEMPRISLFDFLESWMLQANLYEDDLEALEEHYKKFEEADAVIYVNKDDHFKMHAIEAEIGPRTMFYSTADGLLQANMPLWISSDWDKMLISVDRRNWFYADSGNSGDHSNLHVKAHFDPVYDRNKQLLDVGYTWKADLNEELVYHWENKTLPSIRWEIGGIITDTEEDNITMDLREGALFIPKGATVDFNFRFTGNMISNEDLFANVGFDDSSILEATALRDIYLHRNGQSGSISFDNEEWGMMFWDFSYEVEINSSVVDLYKILFRQNMVIEYLPELETAETESLRVSQNP